MAPARAAQAVRLVGLPPDEETAVLAVDVHGQSCLQAAALLHVSVDGLAKIRRRAYAKIADDMQAVSGQFGCPDFLYHRSVKKAHTMYERLLACEYPT